MCLTTASSHSGAFRRQTFQSGVVGDQILYKYWFVLLKVRTKHWNSSSPKDALETE